MQTLVVLTLRSICQVTFPCGTCFLRSSFATYINSVRGACSKRKIPSSASRNSKFSALAYMSGRFMVSKCEWMQSYASGNNILYLVDQKLTMLSQENHLSLPHRVRSRFFRSCLLFLTVFCCTNGSRANAQETFVQPAYNLIPTFPFTVFTG